MKAISLSLIALAMLSIMAMGFVVAEGNQAGVDDSAGTPNLISPAQTDTPVRERVMDGTYMNQAGEPIMIRARNGTRLQLHVGGVNATTDMVMTQEMIQNRTRLHVALSNGENTEVKIMPDVASETALARLRANCNGTCQIELKEVGTGDQVRAAYEVKTQKESRVLGLFKTQMQVQAQVDAETGEVIQAKKPWWAFLATE